MTNYKDSWLKCKVVDDEGLKLDLPFPIFHQTIIFNNANRYCYLSEDMKDQEVLVYVRVKKDEDASKFIGYMGSSWAEVKEKISKYWTVTKEDGLAVTSELGVTTKYNGADKASLMCVHPYLEK